MIISHGPEIAGEKQGSVTYSTDRDDEVSKIFIISLEYCVPGGFWERFPFTRNGFTFLTHVESKRGQFEIVGKSLACFNTHFKAKESFKLLLPIKFENTGQ